MFVPSTRVKRRAINIAAIALVCTPFGCTPKPACSPDNAKGCIVTEVRVRQERGGRDEKVDEDDVKDALITTQSSWFTSDASVALLGEKGSIFLRYERFEPLILERDLARIERFYRTRGFYETRVRAARVFRGGESTVRVEVVVDEGPPTAIASVAVVPTDPATPLPTSSPELNEAVREATALLKEGEPLTEASFDKAKVLLLEAFQNRGYAYAKVDGRAQVDRASHKANIEFLVSAGPPCVFGDISIRADLDLPVAPFRAVIEIEKGAPFSAQTLEQTRYALGRVLSLSTVLVLTNRSKEGEAPATTINAVFIVRKGVLRAIQVGGGAEVGARVEAHVVTEWEHKNFLGGLRHFSVSARTGVLFYPWQLVDFSQQVKPLPNIRTQAELLQPSFFEERTTGSLRVEANLYRPVTADANVNAASQNLYANFELVGTAGLERSFFRSLFRLNTSLNVQVIMPVPIYEDIPKGFDPLVIPYFNAFAALDYRRDKDGQPDPINPHIGVYAGVSAQVAAIVPDEAADIRLQPELRGYVPLWGAAVLAMRASFGVLFPIGYGEPLFNGTSASNQNERTRALQILQLRGFYSGGVNTNRGYGYSGVNPRDVVPNLFNTTGAETLVPVGGRTMWNASIEARIPIKSIFGGALFMDASDVWNDAPVGPHLSPGIGLRIATPIGPLRLDIAYRIPGLQALGGDVCEQNPSAESGCPPLLLDQPIYAALAIGQPF